MIINSQITTQSGGGGGGLPAEYQEVEYIESTGTQRIETGIYNDTLNVPIQYECDVLYPSTTARQLNGSQGAFYYGVVNGRFQLTQGGTSDSGITATANQWYHLIVQFSGNNSDDSNGFVGAVNNIDTNVLRAYIRATQSGYFQYATDASYQVCIFSLNGQNIPSTCRHRKFKIYQNNLLVRNFIPCYRIADNEIGMYDTVNGVFYTNAGTGTFIKGADV